MAKSSKKDLSETIRIMGRLAAMPHKPHVVPKAKKKALKKPAKARRNSV
jgi:hypothetical protein